MGKMEWSLNLLFRYRFYNHKDMITDFSIFLLPEKRYTRKRFSAYFVMDLFLPKWFSPLNEINLYGCSHQTMSSTNSRGRYGVISIFWRTNKPVALSIINLLMREWIRNWCISRAPFELNCLSHFIHEKNTQCT